MLLRAGHPSSGQDSGGQAVLAGRGSSEPPCLGHQRQRGGTHEAEQGSFGVMPQRRRAPGSYSPPCPGPGAGRGVACAEWQGSLLGCCGGKGWQHPKSEGPPCMGDGCSLPRKGWLLETPEQEGTALRSHPPVDLGFHFIS